MNLCNLKLYGQLEYPREEILVKFQKLLHYFEVHNVLVSV